MTATPQEGGVLWGAYGNLGILDSPIVPWYSKSAPVTRAERAYLLRVIGKPWPHYPKELYKGILAGSLALGIPITRAVDCLGSWRNEKGKNFYDGPSRNRMFTVRLRIALEEAILNSPGCTPEEVLAKMDWEFISICTKKLYENYGFVFTGIRTRGSGKEKGLDIRITELPVVGPENLSYIKESMKALKRTEEYCYNPKLIAFPAQLAKAPKPLDPLPLFKDLEKQSENQAESSQSEQYAQKIQEDSRKEKALREQIAADAAVARKKMEVLKELTVQSSGQSILTEREAIKKWNDGKKLEAKEQQRVKEKQEAKERQEVERRKNYQKWLSSQDENAAKNNSINTSSKVDSEPIKPRIPQEAINPEPIKPRIPQEIIDHIAEIFRNDSAISSNLKKEVAVAIHLSHASFSRAISDVNNLMLYYEKEMNKIFSALEKATEPFYPKNPPKA